MCVCVCDGKVLHETPALLPLTLWACSQPLPSPGPWNSACATSLYFASHSQAQIQSDAIPFSMGALSSALYGSNKPMTTSVIP